MTVDTLTCAFEFRVKKLRHGFDAEAERGVTAGQVAVGGQRRAGPGVAAKEAAQPGKMAVAQPLVLREAQNA